MRPICVVLATFSISFAFAAAQDLPTDPGEIEPPILPGNLIPDEAPQATAQPAPDVSQLARKLTRARENAAGAERLFRIGVLAKVEAENRLLRVVRLEAELANAQAATAKVALEQSRSQTSEGAPGSDETAAVEAKLNQAKQAAETAAANLKKAELDAAAVNLERQRKLLALGSSRKSDVRRAEEKLAKLKSEP